MESPSSSFCCFCTWEAQRVTVGDYSSALPPIPSSHLSCVSRGEMQALLKSCHWGQLSGDPFWDAQPLQPAVAGDTDMAWSSQGAVRWELHGQGSVQIWLGNSWSIAPFLKQALVPRYWVPLQKPEGSCCSIPLCVPTYLWKHILLERFQSCREAGTTMTTLPGEAEMSVLDDWGWMKQVKQLSGRVFSHLKVIFMVCLGVQVFPTLTSEARLTCSWHVNVWRNRLIWHKYMQWFNNTILQKKNNSLSWLPDCK